VLLYIGRGDGTFANPVTYLAGVSPTALAIADINNDSALDIAVADGYAPNEAHVLLGLGTGAFQAAAGAAWYGPGTPLLAAADLDGDKLADLAIVNVSSEDVTALLAGPNGTFLGTPPIAAGVAPHALGAADLNGDNAADLLAADSQNSTLALLLAAGDGTLKPPNFYETVGTPGGLTVADLTGDGHPDVAVATGFGIRLFAGKPDGTLADAVVVGTGGNSVVAADLDFDGKPDLAVATDAGDVLVLLSKGSGKFAPERMLMAGPGAQSIVSGDIDGDGLPDLAVASSLMGSKRAIVLLNQNAGNFAPPARYDFAVDPDTAVASLTAGDFDGDGRTDLAAVVTGSVTSTKASVMLSLPGGILAKPVLYPIGPSTRTLVAASVYGRARPDLVATSDRGLSILISNGDGTFKPPLTWRTGFVPWAALPLDIDADGRAEMAVSSASFSGAITILPVVR
jgi:FG-GAP-like repeat/FG-GAP repeat